MIAVVDEFHGAVAETEDGIPVEVKVLPASHPLAQAALRTAAALVAIKELAGMVRQLAVSHVVSGKPASEIAALVRTHAALVSTQTALAEAVVSMVRAAESVPSDSPGDSTSDPM